MLRVLLIADLPAYKLICNDIILPILLYMYLSLIIFFCLAKVLVKKIGPEGPILIVMYSSK
jgi:hypothetical protein